MLLYFFNILAPLAILFFLLTLFEMLFAKRNTFISIALPLISLGLNSVAMIGSLSLEFHRFYVWHNETTNEVYSQFVRYVTADFTMALIFFLFALLSLIRFFAAVWDLWRARHVA